MVEVVYDEQDGLPAHTEEIFQSKEVPTQDMRSPVPVISDYARLEILPAVNKQVYIDLSDQDIPEKPLVGCHIESVAFQRKYESIREKERQDKYTNVFDW